jgi:hypothetical protein
VYENLKISNFEKILWHHDAVVSFSTRFRQVVRHRGGVGTSLESEGLGDHSLTLPGGAKLRRDLQQQVTSWLGFA